MEPFLSLRPLLMSCGFTPGLSIRLSRSFVPLLKCGFLESQIIPDLVYLCAIAVLLVETLVIPAASFTTQVNLLTCKFKSLPDQVLLEAPEQLDLATWEGV